VPTVERYLQPEAVVMGFFLGLGRGACTARGEGRQPLADGNGESEKTSKLKNVRICSFLLTGREVAFAGGGLAQ